MSVARPQLKVLTRAELQDKICLVVGTRPGIIKQSPTVRALEKAGVDFFLIHTGQHYSYDMDRQFFEDLHLPEPAYRLDKVRDFATHGGQTAEMLKGIEDALLIEKPRGVIVGGDANTNLAGALAARKLQLTLGHVEAGLRSHDWRMPEEHNRVMIDHISDLLFAPTEGTRANLEREHVRGKILVTGNTIVDAVVQNLEIAKRHAPVLDQLQVRPRGYFVLTIHREETVDNEAHLRRLLDAIAALATRHAETTIIFPAHPRTRNRLEQFGLLERVAELANLHLVAPLGYLDFLLLMAEAALVLTDSGGIQEEACILQVPCVTLRDNTERPETVAAGANRVSGLDPPAVLAAAEAMLAAPRGWVNPFGAGDAAEQIVGAMVEAIRA